MEVLGVSIWMWLVMTLLSPIWIPVMIITALLDILGFFPHEEGYSMDDCD